MREADRIKEKVTVRLDGKHIAATLAFSVAVGTGIFYAGYVMGQRTVPRSAPGPVAVIAPAAAEAPAPVAPLKEGETAPVGKAAGAPSNPPPPKYTYERTLVEPTPAVQIDDPTLRIAQKMRDDMASADTAAAKGALEAYVADLPASDRAGSAFEGKRITRDPQGARPPPPQAPAPVLAPAEGEHAESDEPSDDLPAGSVPEADNDPAPPEGGSAKGYTVQIKAFREKEEAREFMATLVQAGHKPYLQTSGVKGKGRYYRVRLGKFETLIAAEKKRKAFEKTEGFETIVAPFE